MKNQIKSLILVEETILFTWRNLLSCTKRPTRRYQGNCTGENKRKLVIDMPVVLRNEVVKGNFRNVLPELPSTVEHHVPCF